MIILMVGAGMVTKPEPIFEAVEFKSLVEKARIILLSTSKLFNKNGKRISEEDHLILISCGHYEGY